MEKHVSYYVSRKNVFTWLTVLALIASCVCRIMLANRQPVQPHFWLVTLPVIAAIWIIVIILLAGDELLYRTAVPVALIVVYYIIKTMLAPYSLKMRFLYSVVFLMTGFLYYEIVSGKFGRRIFIWLVLAAGLAITGRSIYLEFALGVPAVGKAMLPDALVLLAGVFLIPAMRIHLDGKFHPTWGDRSDGRRLRSLDPLQQVQAYIMPARYDASNFIRETIEVSDIDAYIMKKRAEGYKNLGFTHVFLAAYVRAVAKYPGINRFMSGERVYSRGNDIQFVMVVKSSMTLEAEESIIKLHLTPYDTIFDIYEKLNKAVDEVKKNPVGGSDFDKTAKLISLIPGPVIHLFMSLIRFLDYFGYIPPFLLEVSPFHASVFFTSMASLGIPPIVHHLYSFGNLPVFCSFGTKYAANEVEKDGTVVRRKYIDYTFNTDERIVDGFYYAAVFKYVNKLLIHPEKLEVPPAEVIRDVD